MSEAHGFACLVGPASGAVARVLDIRTRKHARVVTESLGLATLDAVAVTEALLKLGHKLGCDETKSTSESWALEDLAERSRHLGLDVLADEATENLRVRVGGGVVRTTSKVANVNAGKGVDAIGVTADFAIVGVGQALLDDTCNNVGKAPWVVERAAVVVLGDTFCSAST